MTRIYTPHDRGFFARLEGKIITACPYAKGTQEYKDWRSGWRDQDRHLNSRDKALDSIGWFGR